MSDKEASGYAGRLAKDIYGHKPAVGADMIGRVSGDMTVAECRALGFHYLADLVTTVKEIGYAVSQDEDYVYFTKIFEDHPVCLYVSKDSQYMAFHPYYECKAIADDTGHPLGMTYWAFTASLRWRGKIRAYVLEARREVTFAMGYPDVTFMFEEPIIAMKNPSWKGGAVWVYASEALSLLASYYDEERKRITDLLAKTE